MTNKLGAVKRVVDEYIEEAQFGIFNTRNLVGDRMSNVYDECGTQIDVCFEWGYIEVFGLSDKEFEELEDYYETKRR